MNPYLAKFSHGSFTDRIMGLKQDKKIIYKDFIIIGSYIMILVGIISRIC
ncbi:hypothetical protein HYG86_02465 [Alkalicella caledoniensis]|uniref:Uncharacterized protein n=1 Tax=Alkalicella caledoniensis TaxID=2731377 RepID=A0A7G9W4T6_ALKCA|nr:hypothetical protein [Alkalicella caledoniensis]QNO13698.1 hypothetical protein HYG86_02465 [Alkalicella caledoniensis]